MCLPSSSMLLWTGRKINLSTHKTICYHWLSFTIPALEYRIKIQMVRAGLFGFQFEIILWINIKSELNCWRKFMTRPRISTLWCCRWSVTRGNYILNIEIIIIMLLQRVLVLINRSNCSMRYIVFVCNGVEVMITKHCWQHSQYIRQSVKTIIVYQCFTINWKW